MLQQSMSISSLNLVDIAETDDEFLVVFEEAGPNLTPNPNSLQR